MKVWIVTETIISGNYDATTVDAVFLSEESARQYCKYHQRFTDYSPQYDYEDYEAQP